jgi:hypothetical protein
MSWNPGRYSADEAGRRVKNLKVTMTISGFIMGAVTTYTGYPLVHRILNIAKSDKTVTDPAFYQQHRYAQKEIVKGVKGNQIFITDMENKEIRMGIGYDMHEQSPGGLIDGLGNRIKDGYLKEYFEKNPGELKNLQSLQQKLMEFGIRTQLGTNKLGEGYANPSEITFEIVKTPDGSSQSVINYHGKRGPLLEDKIDSMLSRNYNPEAKRKKFLGIF